MNHIKLYENFNLKDERHKELNLSQWNDFLLKMVSFDQRYMSLLPVEMKKEIRKTLMKSEGMSRNRFGTSFNTNGLVNYLIVYIESDPIFIYEMKDEYFGVYFDGFSASTDLKKTFKIKCDQIDAVIEFIYYIEELLNLKK